MPEEHDNEPEESSNTIWTRFLKGESILSDDEERAFMNQSVATDFTIVNETPYLITDRKMGYGEHKGKMFSTNM